MTLRVVSSEAPWASSKSFCRRKKKHKNKKIADAKINGKQTERVRKVSVQMQQID